VPRRIDVKDVAFGLFLIALALVAFAATARLSVGTAADMGPGFVPRALAWVILGFGTAFCVTGTLKAPEPLPVPAWRPLIAILAAIAVFAVLFSTLGLIAACVGSVLAAGAATAPVRWGRLLLFGPALAAFSALLFVKGLGLPFQLWPSFLARYWAHYWPQLGGW
jgi:Tripartite tricarboxylate transporter TctB family